MEELLRGADCPLGTGRTGVADGSDANPACGVIATQRQSSGLTLIVGFRYSRTPTINYAALNREVDILEMNIMRFIEKTKPWIIGQKMTSGAVGYDREDSAGCANDCPPEEIRAQGAGS